MALPSKDGPGWRIALLLLISGLAGMWTIVLLDWSGPLAAAAMLPCLVAFRFGCSRTYYLLNGEDRWV